MSAPSKIQDAPSSRDTATTSRRKPRRTAGSGSSFPLTIMIWLIALYFALPLVWLVIASTKSNADLFSTYGLAFGNSFALFENIADVFTARDGAFTRWSLNTIFYSVVSAGGATLFAAMAGYAFAKLNFPGRMILFSVTLGSIMIPLTALAVPTYLLFSRAGLVDTPWAVILPSLVSPFGVYLMRVYAESAIPDSMMEAGRMDGVSELGIFWRLCFPLLGPGLVTVLLFSLVATWNNYFLPLIMLNSEDLYPLTVGLAQQQQASSSAGASGGAVFSTVITGSLISTIPLVVAFIVLQRWWQSGLATGSVKD